jgi:hypothetical protein
MRPRAEPKLRVDHARTVNVRMPKEPPGQIDVPDTGHFSEVTLINEPKPVATDENFEVAWRRHGRGRNHALLPQEDQQQPENRPGLSLAVSGILPIVDERTDAVLVEDRGR